MDTNNQSVNSEAPLPSDRPVQNVVGEFNRRFGDLSQKLDAVVGYIANQEAAKVQPPVSPAPKGPRGTLSDDDLWELAKAGDKEAFDQHQERKAARVYMGMRQRESDTQLTQGQLTILTQKYPALRDPSHALTQTANQAYTLLVQRGRPANADTLLDATKTAIADRPDLVAESYTQGARAREGARRVSAGNPSVTGTTYRQADPQQGDDKIRVTSDQAALARRMNIKDPAGAIKRFHERRAAGTSNMGAVGSMLDEGEL